jgi:hypothetical protein
VKEEGHLELGLWRAAVKYGEMLTSEHDDSKQRQAAWRLSSGSGMQILGRKASAALNEEGRRGTDDPSRWSSFQANEVWKQSKDSNAAAAAAACP